MPVTGKKRGRPADSPLVKADKALDAAESAWRDARMAFNKKAHVYKSIASWQAESIVERHKAAAIAAGEKMDQKEGECWKAREAYVQAREDEAVALAAESERRISEEMLRLLGAHMAARSAVSLARYPWREEVLAMSEACEDPSDTQRIQWMHARGVL